MKKKLALNICLVLIVTPVVLEILVLGGILNQSPNTQIIEFFFGKDQTKEDFVEFLDVGQADCTVIRSDKKIAIIDFGVEQDGIKIQKRLLRMGVKEVELAIITHHHSDHMGGFLKVTEKIKIKNLVINNSSAEDGEIELYNKIIQQAKNQKINLILPKEGQSFKIGNANLSILGCDRLAAEENNRSVVSMLNICNKKFLFTGDCDDNAELNLAQKYNLECDVLKMGHHGSKSSSNYLFLRLTEPEIAVASCGYDNLYNHPSTDALLRFEELGIKIYRTDLDKDVCFTFDSGKNNFQISKEGMAA